ncbi:MAG: 30S ribosomal protein S15 [Candidatus Colwellbacteria bacterium RIFCSPHIGHO2_12_FULL_43_12]|uniref:Small ribosomal subunit protein uS15 n=3 Tax=Candidatus Colwelliibacteriota TaxID=1817904 RepID=A0A1G1Z296_9BACT|nr:MAG: 30S ribosomal protein S15 [Candidatus Colwellbacteria bacterium RIFCSPHIGHO2_02_FULL_43_15]OGY58874.1 MAG: 30S ribosomal protein S15 [Candidatus Colwellbacteria bacterium RIFCSPHIGHO2_12_FULL_43_12]OGY61368.1 MAG: 30S ribosomal protein S15 [Candidatus Colwellbacteria bacterium RIFCSPLOWO2_12_FULL_43_11]
MLTTTKKKKIIDEHKKHEKDTGSAEVQVGILSTEMDRLASHLKKNPKDNHSRRGLLGMVGKRRKLLQYLSTNAPESYGKLIKKLGLKR